MTNVYFSSDQHYYHNNIIKYSQRPFASVEEMNEKLIEEHNKIVKPGDEVYNLGDFSFGDEKKTLETLARLNGSKHLILGNHDKMILKQPKKFLGPKYFHSITSYKEIDKGNKIILFHYSCQVWNKSHRGAFHLFGHSHGSLKGIGRSVDVGVDAKFITPEYRPISLDEINSYMANQPFEKVDHHE